MGDIVNAVADVFGMGPASKQSEATTQAAGTSAAASNYAAQLQKQALDQQLALQERIYNEGVARQQPWLAAGQNALARMQGGEYGLPAAFQFDPNQVQYDPGYAFRLEEGQKALERSAAARGGLLSGATGKNLLRYGQQMGSQEYQNAYNRAYGSAMDRYNAEVQRANTGFNRLASMAGIGQTANQALGTAGQNYATGAGAAAGTYGTNVGNLAMVNAANQGNALLAGGNIRASQYGTAGRALDQALNTNWSNVANRLGFSGSSGGVPLPGGGTYSNAYDYTGESWY